MVRSIPDMLKGGGNAAIMSFLNGQSAHSDIAKVLFNTTNTLPGVGVYCSDLKRYGFCVASRMDTVFAYASGMSAIGVRLSPAHIKAALAAGGVQQTKAGEGWIEFKCFHADAAEPDITYWSQCAYDFALPA